MRLKPRCNNSFFAIEDVPERREGRKKKDRKRGRQPALKREMSVR